MAFKKPTATVAVPESPDRLFRDLSRRRHPSLFDHQGQMLRNYVAEDRAFVMSVVRNCCDYLGSRSK